jgi:hypothetical protein
MPWEWVACDSEQDRKSVKIVTQSCWILPKGSCLDDVMKEFNGQLATQVSHLHRGLQQYSTALNNHNATKVSLT